MSQIPNNSRFQKKQGKRRKGFLLNILLGIVLLTAVTVAYQLFTSSPEQTATKETKTKEAKTTSAAQKKKEDTGQLVVKEDDKDSAKEEEASTQPTEDTKVAVEDQTDPAVQEAYTNPSWQAIGTSQSGPHTTQFDDSTQDWKEMTQAISYAVQVPADTLTIWYLGNNGPNKAVGTVTAKATKQKYKVYIEWVDNEGWKPTLVQLMK